MEGLPMLTCLIQHTLKTLCTCSSSEDNTSNKWVYAVFWRILPRIYPPPKWDVEGGVLDRAKGNKRNWILVWEDGFCDIDECERVGNDGSSKGGFGADIFFKLSHEVYNYGEGLIGKIAADNSHKWVFKDGLNEHDPSFISSWNASIDPQPKAWEFHFNSGIKTIAIISTREGIIQLGSFDKIIEDLNLVLSIRRKFSYLRTIPGLFSIQRPFSTVQHSYNPLKHKSTIGPDEAQQVTGSKVNVHGGESEPHKGPIWSLGSGYINQESGPSLWAIPPLLPYNYGSHDHLARIRNDGVDQSVRDKISRVEDPGEEGKSRCLNTNPGFGMELGFGPKRVAQESDVKFQLN
ncbi:putative transcription factor MYC/MYB [Helianthus annuus]|uniref:Transcription factor MYC/MYB n=1 Tax=Helianthus annuus TaxID=4232 RepID=A0A251TIA8_HELAN|nr:protein RICE SALT SENSITIVE 3 [Helianthus annuus]KAF5817529.1 putative transcription factor MYC/MYB [Helianthus annuus]KAJ0776452.1 putative transcription factor MYC/MYB [Helianthus annuus]KAJ0938940.1 putative transcription factor MYC/MYB [Helianthus annuus]